MLLFYQQVKAQSYSFCNFAGTSNIPSTYIYTLNQDGNGFLWVGTDNGLAKFDGFTFHPVPFPDSIASRYPNCSFKDNTGKLWFGFNDGSLFFTGNEGLVKFKDEGLQSINQILQGDEEYITVIPQEKVIVKIRTDKPDEILKYYVPRNITMTCAAFTTDGNILLGTMQNLLYCILQGDSVKVLNTVEGIEYTKVQNIVPIEKTGIFIIGTEGAGIYLLDFRNNTPVLEKPSSNILADNLDVRSVYKGTNGNIWLSTFGSGLIEVELGTGGDIFRNIKVFNTGNGLQSNDVKCAFEDSEGNIWAGLYGEGLSMLCSQALFLYAPGDIPEKNNIIYIASEGARYFLGTTSGFYYFDPATGKADRFVDLRTKINSEISTFLYENPSYIWAGTRGKGLFRADREGQVRQIFISENSGQNYIRHITGDGQNLWLSTLDGILVVNRNNGNLVRKFNIEDRLPHNSINQIIILNSGYALPATECDRLYLITLEKGVEIGKRIMTGFTRNKVLCYAESKAGDIWAGTAGNGLFWFSGDSVNNITTVNGLLSNFCYSIMSDTDGTIWSGHESGFSRFEPSTGIVKKYTPDFIKGANCNPSAIAEDSDKRIIIGTTAGLVIYEKTKERQINLAPRSNIVAVTINNVRYPVSREYILPYNKYTIKIEYVGINFSNPEGVYYSTKMDNWDSRWTEMTTERQVTYSLRDGRYRFNMISYSSEGLSSQEPVFVDFYIKTPFWRAWWFISLIIITVTGLVLFIVWQRDKAQQKIKKYLEEELDKRTGEVVKQKEKIEMQNLEITDSINYARRIQASILPDISKLSEVFSESFVIFYPRDIVSGDFYWFDRLDSERFILVCADSTGHGVPGAFMSMIGSTLLQDIISRKGITRPSQILTLLDKQIISTLNQNVDVGASNDGMDLVICEINIPKRHIRFASAMRPLIIVMGGELYYIKGNKYSIGGESVMEKYFDDQEYYMGKGDSIYLFSDGFPDQFGGSDGKKMKIVRFKNLIEEVQYLPMTKQKEIIEKFFFDWKDNYTQVDDILVMGLRL
ncbi:MAG: two-component regulator propeller domain-containing protein [Bacteroidales bacterium]